MECNDIHHVLGTNAMKFLKHQRKTKKPLKTLLPRRIVCQEKRRLFSTSLKKKELERADSQSESSNIRSLRSLILEAKKCFCSLRSKNNVVQSLRSFTTLFWKKKIKKICIVQSTVLELFFSLHFVREKKEKRRYPTTTYFLRIFEKRCCNSDIFRLFLILVVISFLKIDFNRSKNGSRHRL